MTDSALLHMFRLFQISIGDYSHPPLSGLNQRLNMLRMGMTERLYICHTHSMLHTHRVSKLSNFLSEIVFKIFIDKEAG